MIARDTNILANLESLDNGKPFENAKGDMYFCTMLLRYYAGYADKAHGRTIPTEPNMFSYVRKEPIGVCGQIIPWNYPALMTVFKIAPVLATGCVTVLKPAEQTPLTALYIAALTKEAGIPDGVINIVTGNINYTYLLDIIKLVLNFIQDMVQQLVLQFQCIQISERLHSQVQQK